MAEDLRFASTRDLIHRDIKPSNILRSKSGEIKITDLGLALHTEFEDKRVTREGTTVGTVDYMAPEQARDSRAASLQSDLYSLGCTFYYLLTGIPPYPGGDITDKLTRHANSAPPDVRDLCPDVPEALSQVMLRMMAKRMEDRFASFDDLSEALERVPVRDEAESPGVALMPLDPPDSLVSDVPTVRPGVRANSDPDGAESRPLSSTPEISLASLPADLVQDDQPSTFVRVVGRESTTGVLPRLRGTQSLASWVGPPGAIPVRDRRQSALSTSAGFDLGRGSVDVAVRETIFLGSQGPLVRGLDSERRGDQRFSVAGGVLASRGPGFQLQEAADGDAQRKPTPLVIRAFDTVFGRFQGAGIASILCSESPAASPRDRVDWLGQQNLFCGWKGYYYPGKDVSHAAAY